MRPAKLLKSENEELRWLAVFSRDKQSDGTFVYSVATTGVYCRPSCPSRRAHRANVTFHDTPTAAERLGFRACKRCKPDQQPASTALAKKISAICRAIESAETPPKLDDLAALAGLSAFHFHRVFKEMTGVTPKAYAVAHRNARLRDGLDKETRVTDAIFAAGFNSSSRAYAGSDAALGMTPRNFKSGGKGTELKLAVAQCSLGAILVAASSKGIAAILLGDDPAPLLEDVQKRFPHATFIGGDAAFEKRVARVIGLVERPGVAHTLPLDVQGTAFQHRVWLALRDIPPGTTSSYQEIAERIGKPKSVRAVAGACAANPVAVAIPCHRVVRTDGGLSGYRWGIDRKRALLQREQNTRRRKD